MQYPSFDWKDKKGITQKSIPGLAVRLKILIIIVLLAACGDDSGSSNNNPETFTISSNADLADLSFHGTLDQPFGADQYDYTATVAYRFKSVQVTPITADENATVTVNGVTVRSGFASSPIDLIVGQNAPIIVEVTAEDNLVSKVYQLVVTVEPPSTDADLASFGLSVGALAPVFDPATTAYAVFVSFSTATVQLHPETNHSGATITVNGVPLPFSQYTDPISLAFGDNNITLQVTAEDGVSTKSYGLAVNRDRGDNANLSDLTISTGVLDSIFQPFIADYTASVGFVDSTIQVIATTEAVGASVSVNTTTAVSGGASQPIPLGEGSNLVTILVTAENGVTNKIYTLLVERQSTSNFLQQAYLKASNTGFGDQFGTSVALSGDTLAVGVPGEDSNATGVNGIESNNLAFNSGAVYVFTRNSNNQWSQQAYLKGSNTEVNDRFGTSVALSDNTLAIGARYEDSNATGVNGDESNNSASFSGAVYVFTRDVNSQWSQQAYLKASNTGFGDQFGASVALSGDTLAVGALFEDSFTTGVGGDESNNLAASSGAVYVFTRGSNNQWSQQAYLKASNTGFGDYFGYSISLSDDTLAVGAYGEDGNSTGVNGDESNNFLSASGSVYVFIRGNNNQWSQQAYLKASNTGYADLFGYSVSLSGDSLAVGAYSEDSNATGINGDESNNLAGASGSVYVFNRDVNSEWLQQTYLKASNTQGFGYFGYSVSLSSDTLAVGAYGEDSYTTGVNSDESISSASVSGAVYVFTRDIGNLWSQQAYIKASNTDSYDYFGSNVAISGNTLAVGAVQEDSNATGVNGNQANNEATQSGAVYVYQ